MLPQRSSPVTRTISSVHNGFELWTLDFLFGWFGFWCQNPMLAILMDIENYLYL